jgi:hypothetical protein
MQLEAKSLEWFDHVRQMGRSTLWRVSESNCMKQKLCLSSSLLYKFPGVSGHLGSSPFQNTPSHVSERLRTQELTCLSRCQLCCRQADRFEMSSCQICGKLTQCGGGDVSFLPQNRGRGITWVNLTCVPVSITHALTCWHTGLLPGPHAASDPLTSLSLSRLSLSRHLRAAGLCPRSVNIGILFHSIWNSVDGLGTLWLNQKVPSNHFAILHVSIVLMFEPNQQYTHCTLLAGPHYVPLYFGNPLTSSKATLPAPGSWQQVPTVAALPCF